MVDDSFPPWGLMLAADLVFLALAAGGTAAFMYRREELRRSGAVNGILLIVLGLWVGAALYIADFAAMTLLPKTLGMPSAMETMRRLHLEYSWYINSASALLIFFGLLLTIFQLVRQNREIAKRNERIVENENLLDSIFENLPVGLLIKDSNHNVERPNRTYSSWYGSDVEKMIGQRSDQVEDFQPDDDAKVMNAQEDRVLRTGEVISRQVERRFVDGDLHTVHITKFPIYDQFGKIHKVGSVSVDITDRVRAETAAHAARAEAETASLAKTEFLASMSHELRTPLNAINGFAEVIAQEMFGAHANPKYQEYALDIHTSGQYLLSIINDVLDLSKIEAGQLKAELEVFPLKDAIVDCTRLIAATVQNAPIEVSVADETPDVRADPRFFRQILINILSNARKYTADDGTISIVTARNDESETVIRISDTGTGIAPEDLPRVMEPFGQARAHVHLSHEGTGLGLPLSKTMMELQGGRLEIESILGKGTTVTLIFPAD